MFGLPALAWTIFGGRQLVVGLFKFLSTPLGQVVAVVGALLLTAIVTDVHARIRDRAVCNQRIETNNAGWQKRELEAKAAYDAARSKRDSEVSAAVQQGADAKVRSIQDLADRLALQVKAHEANRPAASACRVSPGLVERRDRMLNPKK